MRNKPLTELAHQLIREKLPPGGIAVDATMGNGHDTLFLASTLGTQGEVFAFDIQEQAISATKTRLSECDNCARVTLFNQSHDRISQLLPASTHEKINAAMFNLGYLPGSDKQIITRRKSTIAALEALAPLLSEHGCITIMAYPGHEGGAEECSSVVDWVNSLPQSKFKTTIHKSQSINGPILLAVEKLKPEKSACNEKFGQAYPSEF
jgi:hypothetical protein